MTWKLEFWAENEKKNKTEKYWKSVIFKFTICRIDKLFFKLIWSYLASLGNLKIHCLACYSLVFTTTFKHNFLRVCFLPTKPRNYDEVWITAKVFWAADCFSQETALEMRKKSTIDFWLTIDFWVLGPRTSSLRVYDRKSFTSFHVQAVAPVILVKPIDTLPLASVNISPPT